MSLIQVATISDFSSKASHASHVSHVFFVSRSTPLVIINFFLARWEPSSIRWL